MSLSSEQSPHPQCNANAQRTMQCTVSMLSPQIQCHVVNQIIYGTIYLVINSLSLINLN